MSQAGKLVRKAPASARRKSLPRGRQIEVNVYEAKTHFSELLRRVESGDEVIIARDGAAVARLQRATPAQMGPRRGEDQDRD